MHHTQTSACMILAPHPDDTANNIIYWHAGWPCLTLWRVPTFWKHWRQTSTIKFWFYKKALHLWFMVRVHYMHGKCTFVVHGNNVRLMMISIYAYITDISRDRSVSSSYFMNTISTMHNNIWQRQLSRLVHSIFTDT